MEVQPFQKIVLEIESRIRRGRYASGSALPPRLRLMEEFGVARATLDRAIQELIRRGRCASRRGAGTYVLPQDTMRYRVAHIGWNIGKDYPIEFDITHLGPDVPPRSEWSKLLDYDGILWVAPSQEHMAIMDELSGKLPQVAVNRITQSIPFVSIDYRSTYRDITRERLEAHPNCRMIFLRSPHPTLAVDYRLQGFLDACRAQEKFNEVLEMPEDFAAKLQLLEDRLPQDAQRPLVIVSDSVNHTGAVMRWAVQHHPQAQWGINLFYSDFDNDYSSNVWGLIVTSFLQDNEAMTMRGAEDLLTMIKGRRTDGDSVLIAPLRRYGDT